ncbi:MAG: acyl-CoA dehydrogenase [Candidatus Schekmanbacteria bacterium GWA2_38_11]|uniref:Acyl-CoA dehydrogenase n=2 Tax=Bacteria candidate phyla TaxID=1783234 RepID=A0A1F7RAE3_9BACT|nr:MAG: acyl-CoA dehydrogenase [Candidatus Schekmanbacteria bacterium GWA2_38_11]
MDFKLTEEQNMLKDMCRNFAQNEIMPNADAWNKTGEFPTAIFKKMAELDLMGVLIPEEYGGSNAGTVAFVAAMEEISKGDQSVAVTWNAHLTIGSVAFLYFGTEEQKKKFLVPLAKGEALGAFGLTEANAGSDARGIKTKAVLDGNEWVINGTKCFITNVGTPLSYGVIILATTGEDQKGNKKFSAFVVPKDAKGFTIGKRYEKIGWHAVDTRELIFEDCRIPKGNLLGKEGEGLKQFLEVLDVGRISIAAISVGLAQKAFELALYHSQERVQFGKPICKNQAIQFKLADMATRIEISRLITYKAAWLRDNNLPYALEAAMAKTYASETAVRVAEEALQIHGGYGYTEEYLISRLYRDSKVLTIGEGTNEIQRMVIAKLIGC